MRDVNIYERYPYFYLKSDTPIKEIEYFKVGQSAYCLSVGGQEYYDYPSELSSKFLKNADIMQAEVLRTDIVGDVSECMSYFINKSHIEKIEKSAGGYVVKLKNGNVLSCNSCIDLTEPSSNHR